MMKIFIKAKVHNQMFLKKNKVKNIMKYNYENYYKINIKKKK